MPQVVRRRPPQLQEERSGSSIEELEKYLDIDKNELDDELVNQPNWYYRVARFATEAASLVAQRKADMERIEAELSEEYREQFEAEERRPTKVALEQAVAADPRFTSAKQGYLRAGELSLRAAALRDAMAQRKDSLKGLAQLYASDYFASTSDSVTINYRDRMAAKGKAAYREFREKQYRDKEGEDSGKRRRRDED